MGQLWISMEGDRAQIYVGERTGVMDATLINMKLYLSGIKVDIEFPDGSIKTGRVGVSKGRPPQFWLISRNGQFHEIHGKCVVLGPALRKNRIDNPDYLNGRIPTFRVEGHPELQCGECGAKVTNGDMVVLRAPKLEFQCPRCKRWGHI